jgi:hypothetical protein
MRRSRREHSTKLVDNFFKPFRDKIGEYNDEYCKIDAFYSKEIGKFVSSKPAEPENIQFYEEAMSHLRNYNNLLGDWKKLKEITLELNEELANMFEEYRLLIKNEIDLPYWCISYSGDEPFEYLCPTAFIKDTYEEIYRRLERNSKTFAGNGQIQLVTDGDKKTYRYNWAGGYGIIARSPDEDKIKKIQLSFGNLINSEKYVEQIRSFLNRKRETYDRQVKKVKQDIEEIIKTIELGGKIKGKCQYCP